MLLYDCPNPAPNPRRVRIYLHEKGLSLPLREVSLMAREHKSRDFLAKNPLGQVPALETDDGTVISESVSICRYLEALHPSPPLFGNTPLDIALTDMWLRRVENVLMQPVGMVWVHTHPYTAGLGTQYKDFGEASRERALKAMSWFDAQLQGRTFLAGDTYSVADIALLTTLDFSTWIGLPMPADCPELARWHAVVAARPSAMA